MKTRNGIPTGAYAERMERTATWSDWLVGQVRVQADHFWGVRRRYRWLLTGVAAIESDLAQLDAEALVQFGQELRGELIHQGETKALTCRALAWIRETASRTLARRPSDAQLLAAVTMLRAGFAELPSCEGKSLAIAMAAATRALCGLPVEVVTAREEQAHIAHETLRPLYAALGLRSALVTRESAPDELHATYSSDVTYVSGARLLHDYLTDRVQLRGAKSRPRLALERLVSPVAARLDRLALGGLHSAFLEDVDQVLIDDSQRPIAVPESRESTELHGSNVQALSIGRELHEGEHFSVDPEAWSVALTAQGERVLTASCQSLGGAWQRPAWRSRQVQIALSALHLWQAGVTHEFRSGQLRLLGPGREHLGQNSSELISMLALLDTRDEAHHEAPQRRMSLPRFFRRYRNLAGCAETLWEVRRELSSTYELSIQCVPPSSAAGPEFVRRWAFLSEQQRDRHLVDRLHAITGAGDAVLVGVRTNEGMLKLRQQLESTSLRVACVELTPAGSATGTELFEAGESGRVTIATSQGLRGAAVEHSARLHVVAAEPMGTRRLDRVLFNHAQGSAAEFPRESYVALTDALLVGQYPGLMDALFKRTGNPDGTIPERLLRPFVYRAQRSQERDLYTRRQAMLKAETSQGVALAFGGGDH